MPVNKPPFGGAGRRRRNRLSGSSLVSWERCPRAWMVKRRIGLRGPVRPSMILGILLEDAVVGLLMESPPSDGSQPHGRSLFLEHQGDQNHDEVETKCIDSLEGINDWLYSLIPALAKHVHSRFLVEWEQTPWKKEGSGPEDIKLEIIQEQIGSALKMQIAEAQKCLDSNGGPHLNQFRLEGDPFRPVAPRWASEPGEPHSTEGFQKEGDQTNWWEAWEISRPWMKDPRIPSAQRIHHPEGWASGEMDVVHRWRENATIVDIKSGWGAGKPQPNLEAQIGFYRWLWNQTRTSDSQGVDSLEGWFLLDGHIHRIQALPDSIMDIETQRLSRIRDQMAKIEEQDWKWISENGTPLGHPLYCPHCKGLEICGYSTDPEDRAIRSFLPKINFEIPENANAISDLPYRLSVRGSIDGVWREMENSYGELVRVATLRAGNTMITIEETEEGVVDPHSWNGEIGITNANPGIFRGRPHLFLDSKSKLVEFDADEDWIRLGLIPTRATVSGQVVSMGRNQGVSGNGRPWTIHSLHIWDGTGVVEIAAFGSNRSRTFESMTVGDHMIVHHGELGWREGNPQIQLGRQTSLEHLQSDS
ncbi:MAG: hypothetical protein QGH13_06975 [Candidatus Thalassarchaeaceae archaeon]|nr:hypothetical protein [Candidatus Thalassarchaeaceae archaeon]